MIADPKKFAFFIPNIFTALNMACGFTSIIFSWHSSFYNASMFLVLGGIFDLIDGRIARITGTESSFGEQFDSMSDLVSFGLAPTLLVYQRFFVNFGRLGLIVSFLFLLCGALRLARFNANIDKVSSNFFQGLPIPGAAYALAGYVLVSLEFPIIVSKLYIISFFYTLFYAFLMISNIPFCSFKNSEWVKGHKKLVLLLIFIILSALFLYEEFMIAILLSVYVAGSLGYFIVNRSRFTDIFDWKSEQ